ncbi:MAG: TTT family transport system small permease component [Saliniramus fredricksonii]|uniref:TTT family transport system small permease component n=1 Tax=Saliniramus fredricksonii TaxID=1653334 RepID=A0A0P8AB11_9HYPH|nr:tripartite tricarboxylate transporter TctB family protein [Saliniramus fredricksonii]KPQ12389.1 MAG: TTT family transport system small permease component [Saliniramus fredricksonii]SCC81291.1 Tripartite tricarboxylate transporter TctB family protein [Saliniramus fredricksonii]
MTSQAEHARRILQSAPLLRLGRAVPGLALVLTGLAMLILAYGQPAWLDAHVGPGLFAQLLSKGVIALGAIWAAFRALDATPRRPAPCAEPADATAQRWSGPALLGAVLLFALSLPAFGLVISAGLAATLAAIGAGERNPVALAVTVCALVVMTMVIGLTLLPPTAPLWPRL